MTARNITIFITTLICIALTFWYLASNNDDISINSIEHPEGSIGSEIIASRDVPATKPPDHQPDDERFQAGTWRYERLPLENYSGMLRLLSGGRLSQADKDAALDNLLPWGNVKIGRLLVEHGATFNEEACIDESYLGEAAIRGDVDMIRFLVELGACIDCQCKTDAGDGGTPLYQAAMWGKAEAVEELLKAGADLEIDTEWYFTPLMIAAQNGNTECVKILLKYGAGVSFGDERPDPAWLARENGHEDVALLLEGKKTK